MSKSLTRRACLWVLAASPFMTATKSTAMFAKQPNQDLVESSELIVTATLTQIEMTSGAFPRRIGTLSILTVLKGQPELQKAQLALPGGAGFLSSSDIDYPAGSSGLWFLRATDPQIPDLYAADGPQRFVPESEATSVINSLVNYLSK